MTELLIWLFNSFAKLTHYFQIVVTWILEKPYI